ncbi:amidohydrolase family protein [Basidiobolus meristosporus CBS 931.73]|uniref:Amidohydrolase family protein n=1 Tax=Basidiobolus meristosporus CBS 931.73 TaxID=1314790 RepID=A0A1Y1YGR1_9FUNG|nr:amidohydrolase family protein [Basidiobolus meristosporus CBS 931.73]|eukprot:ORX97043.1 amidohydrolase family protein [Basidiobolus meristosporus CBS 931.73]
MLRLLALFHSILASPIVKRQDFSDNTAILLQGGTFITYNETTASLEVINGSMLIINDTIVEIGANLPNLPPHIEIVNVTGRIITPGFVDTHRHGWQTAFRTQGEDLTLGRYFYTFANFGAAAQIFDAEDVYIGQLMGLYEAIDAGVTSIVDHAHHTWSKETAQAGLQASIDSGNRVWWCYAVQPVPIQSDPYVLDKNTTSWQLAQIAEMVTNRPLTGDRVNIGLAYDQLNLPEEEVASIFEFVKKQNLSLITTHYLGGVFQGEFHSIEVLDKYRLLDIDTPIIVSHASYITPQEIELLRKANQYISITSESEMHYGHGHPYSYSIQDQGSLGIDTHFTFSSDIITQMRMNMQTTRLTMYKMTIEQGHLPSNTGMTVNQAFLMGTRNGGLALRRDDIGVLKVVFDTNRPGLLGWKDAVAAIVLHANTGDIEHVIVDGKFRKRDRRLVDVDWITSQDRFLRTIPSASSEFIAHGVYSGRDAIPHATPIFFSLGGGKVTKVGEIFI